MNIIAKVEDDYHEMTELKKRAQAADAAKSQGCYTCSWTTMDTDLDVLQQDYITTAQASGRALVSLINNVLDQAKIESRKLELEDVQFDLRGILYDVLPLFFGKSQGSREATVEVLPRLFKLKYESGTLDELLYVDMLREYQNSSGQIVLDYAKAIQESVFEQLRVVRDGQLRIVFSQDLKICSWEFCARRHEELIPKRLLIPQV